MISARAIFRPRGDAGQFIDAKITPGVRASVQAFCDTVQQAAKGYAPVLTGDLVSKIDVEINDSGKTVVGRVVSRSDHGGFVEFGTGQRGDPSVPHRQDWPGMYPQPYMRPAFDENRGSAIDLFAGNLGVNLAR